MALIGLLGSGLGSLAGILASSRLTQYRLEQLEKKVQAHNNLIHRTYQLEQADRLREEQLKVLRHRMAELEGGER